MRRWLQSSSYDVGSHRGDHFRQAWTWSIAVHVFLSARVYPAVVRESQDVVELALKRALQFMGIVRSPERDDIHDVAGRYMDRLPRERRQPVAALSGALTGVAQDRAPACHRTSRWLGGTGPRLLGRPLRAAARGETMRGGDERRGRADSDMATNPKAVLRPDPHWLSGAVVVGKANGSAPSSFIVLARPGLLAPGQ